MVYVFLQVSFYNMDQDFHCATMICVVQSNYNNEDVRLKYLKNVNGCMKDREGWNGMGVRQEGKRRGRENCRDVLGYLY